jgi:hypothetical protein
LKKGEVDYAGSAKDLAADEDFVRASYLGESGGVVTKPAAKAAEPIAKPTTVMESVRVALPPALIRGLEERAAREGVDAEELVRRVVEGNIDELDGNGTKTKKRKSTTGGRRRDS